MLKLFEYAKLTPIYEIIIPFKQRRELNDWIKRNKLPPTPQLIKQKIIKNFAIKYKISTLIETGTYLGTTIDAIKDSFKKIYTIELDKLLYKRAKRKFKNKKNIFCYQGDSGKILSNILKKINKPAIFWLDAHYSKGITAKGEKETPIIDEVNHILNHYIKKHTILIDDADNFKNHKYYPRIEQLRKLVSEKYPRYKFKILHNIICVYP